MGYTPRGSKKSDTTERLHFSQIIQTNHLISKSLITSAKPSLTFFFFFLPCKVIFIGSRDSEMEIFSGDTHFSAYHRLEIEI